jgi:hypothetical protein
MTVKDPGDGTAGSYPPKPEEPKENDSSGADATGERSAVASRRPDGRPDHSAARSAVFGLVGALIGGVASFGGSYWTAQQAQSSVQVSAERSAYVSFTARSYQYMDNLVQLERGVNPSLYATLRTSLNNEIGPLFSALALVQYVGSKTAGKTSFKVGNALASMYIPVDAGTLDHARLAAAIKEAQGFLGNFERATVNQLDG